MDGLMKTEYNCCSSCKDPISDRYFVKVGDHPWHDACLRCCVCQNKLGDHLSCWFKDNRIYCKDDFDKTFTVPQCAKCLRKISSVDWVRKAKDLTFHLACFSCDSCDRQLSTGEEFALLCGDQILCREHYMETIEVETGSSGDDSVMGDDANKKKIKRIRTAFTEEQLEVLTKSFDMDSNPDGQDLERIAINAGLSKRVTQVWFQNSRARQKKHSYYAKRKSPYEINVHLRTNVLL